MANEIIAAEQAKIAIEQAIVNEEQQKVYESQRIMYPIVEERRLIVIKELLELCKPKY